MSQNENKGKRDIPGSRLIEYWPAGMSRLNGWITPSSSSNQNGRLVRSPKEVFMDSLIDSNGPSTQILRIMSPNFTMTTFLPDNWRSPPLAFVSLKHIVEPHWLRRLDVDHFISWWKHCWITIMVQLAIQIQHSSRSCRCYHPYSLYSTVLIATDPVQKIDRKIHYVYIICTFKTKRWSTKSKLGPE
jgi:hypothetical protein